MGKTSKKKKKITFKLQFSLACILTFAVFTTAAIIQIPWYTISKRNISDVVLNLNREIVNGIAGQIGNLFGSSVSSLQTIQEILNKDLISLEERTALGRLYLTYLMSNENFSWVSFGWPNGDFFGVQRESKTDFKIVDSRWGGTAKKATRKVDFYSKIEFVSTHTIKNHPYYAPERSWFKKAIVSRDPVWTDVYIFNTSKKPGVNSAITFEQKGKATGVITIAMELDMISRYLDSIQVAKNGEVFIINNKGKMIAFHDPSEITFASNGLESLRLKSIFEAKNRYLWVAGEAIQSKKVNISDVRKLTMIVQENEKGEKFYVTFAPARYMQWIICTVIPETDYLAEINKNVQKLLLILFIFLILMLFVAFLIAKAILVTPITTITDQIRDVQHLKVDDIKGIQSRIKEIKTLSSAMVQMGIGLTSFNKYMPTNLVRTLLNRGIEAKVGGEEKAVSIFFSDLVSFTKMSEQYGNALVPHLGECLGEMSREINRQNGTIDKYIGDAIMAFWGAPEPSENHALDACRAALHAQERLKQLRIRWKEEDKPQFQARIGINTGTVIVGNVGYDERMDYTILGDSVNVANRLETLNKFYGTNILIGEETYMSAKSGIIARTIDNVALYGKKKGIAIYELLAMKNEMSVMDNFDWVRPFEQGINFYKKREWRSAIACFKKTIQLRDGKDRPSAIYIIRCNKFIAHPPPQNTWNRVRVMTRK